MQQARSPTDKKATRAETNTEDLRRCVPRVPRPACTQDEDQGQERVNSDKLPPTAPMSLEMLMHKR